MQTLSGNSIVPLATTSKSKSNSGKKPIDKNHLDFLDNFFKAKSTTHPEQTLQDKIKDENKLYEQVDL